ncbi:hypothetical protein [Spiroplasma endosymbiont of Clivina fossor]|uniref:hypothetical protein n=1 Tax=Spiroplasma endosymbiont of Clivina fossor TaxID=3066282 RepID=UPI00313BDD25
MKIRDKKIVFIGEDGQPEKNADGTFKVKNLYRGFTEQNDYTANFQEKAKNLLQRETDALKKLADKEKEYLTFKKEQEINKLIQDANIDNQFINFVKNSINFENDIEVIKNDINNFVVTMPKIKHTLDTGGVPNKADDKNNNPSNSEEIIFSSDALTPQELMFKRKEDK